MIKQLFIITIWLITNVSSETEVCGEITYSTDWVLKNSPYVVINDIYIPKMSRLRVEPGVVVQFKKPQPCKHMYIQEDWADSAFSTFKVEGSLFLTGTEEQPVVFENYEGNNDVTGWDGIRISEKSAQLIEVFGVKFHGANKALNIKRSTFRVSNSIFEKNNVGINLEQGANVRIYNNNFMENRSSGIVLHGSNPVIVNNIFAFNHNYGVWSDSRMNLQIAYNNFWKNAEGHCYKCPAKVLVQSGVNHQKTSVDEFQNMSVDPAFKDSKAHKKGREKDLTLFTDIEKVKNKKIAKREWQAVKNQKDYKAPPQFKYLGTGPYLLSKYSPLINAGHLDKNYNDRDGTRNDIGYHGGPPSASTFEAGKSLRKKKK